MKRRTSVCFALLVALTALPAFAGTVYVPILSQNGFDGAEYATRVWLTNEGNGPLTVETLLLPMNTNGIKGREDGGGGGDEVTVRAGRTVVLVVDGGPGLLEITSTGDAAGQLAINAELRQTGINGAAVAHASPPVIGSQNVVEAGGTLTLQGMRRSLAGVLSNLLLANLGHEDSQCTAKVFHAAGVQISGTALLSLKALSQVQFTDSLGLLGVEQALDVRAQISCDQPFYAYLAHYENETGEVVFIQPSIRGDSSLAPPGAEEPSAPGAILFTRGGNFHTPSPANPSAIFNIPVPGDKAYKNVVVDFDFLHAGWYGQDPSGLHSLVWLHRGACCWPQWAGNITVFANAHGPGKNQIKMISNMDQPRFAEKSRGEARYGLQAGQRYHAHFEYDTSRGVAYLEISQGGNQVVHMTMPTTVSRLEADASNAWMIYFGHENAYGTGHGAERPTYGWKYDNLRVEFLP